MLKITKEYIKSDQLDTTAITLKHSMLLERGTHLFIASHKWDSVYVELHPELRADALHYLPTVTEKVQVYCDGKLEDYMQCLVELFPSKSGAIRKAVMQRQDLSSVLGDSVLCTAL